MGLTMSKATKSERDAAIAALTDTTAWGIRPGQTIYTCVSRVARSGMSRSIRCLVVSSHGEPYADGYLVNAARPHGVSPFDRTMGATMHSIADISGMVARATGLQFDRTHGGVRVSGCGSDMGFMLVDSLAYALQMPLRQYWI